MSEKNTDPGKERRMLREGLVDEEIQAVQSLVDHCREAEKEIRSLHLRYGMTGLGRLEELKKMLNLLERTIETARSENLSILSDLIDLAHKIHEEIVFWSNEIRKAFEEA